MRRYTARQSSVTVSFQKLTDIFSTSGRHCDDAGGLVLQMIFCFVFNCRPLSFDNGFTDLNAYYCVNTVDEKNSMAKNLVNFDPRDVTIAMNFVARNGDKLAEMPFWFVLAFYNGWEDRKTYTHTETLDVCILYIL